MKIFLRIHIDFAIIQMVGNGTKSLTNGTLISTSYKQYNWTPLGKPAHYPLNYERLTYVGIYLYTYIVGHFLCLIKSWVK